KNEVTSNQPTGVENGDTTNGQSTIDILTLDDNGDEYLISGVTAEGREVLSDAISLMNTLHNGQGYDSLEVTYSVEIHPRGSSSSSKGRKALAAGVVAEEQRREKTSAVATPSAWEARQASQGSSGLGEELLASGGTSSRDPLNATAHLTTSAQVGVTENEGLQKRQKPGSKSTKKTPDTKENHTCLEESLKQINLRCQDKSFNLINIMLQWHQYLKLMKNTRRHFTEWFKSYLGDRRQVEAQSEERETHVRHRKDPLIQGFGLTRMRPGIGVRDDMRHRPQYQVAPVCVVRPIEIL
ncbi:unnamed protein product, partial [Meganyctiphanes norvegica]